MAMNALAVTQVTTVTAQATIKAANVTIELEKEKAEDFRLPPLSLLLSPFA
jgi:hypothetical protein